MNHYNNSNNNNSLPLPTQPIDPKVYRRQQKERELNHMGVLGASLLEELDSQIELGLITPDVAREIVKQFDFSYAEQIEVLSNQPSHIDATLEANLDMYRFFDDTADLELSHVKIKYTKPDQTRVKQTDKVFIRALDPDQTF